MVEHVTLSATKPFEAAQSALEASALIIDLD
ncbi:hypothetical protein JOE48_001383 [Methylobacterium sp. PvR107]|nr:hypothetical protein [Methylobacterium sp. PvR107]